MAHQNKHEVSIKKVGNKWKVVDADTGTGETKAKKGQNVTWHAHGSDVHIQFMDDKLFGPWTKVVPEGKSRTLGVGNNAQQDANPYAVFCIADKKYAEGGSPPRIIIE